MQGDGNLSPNAKSNSPDCAFCQYNSIASHILKETATFRLVADYAPFVEGHMLIIPKQHYTCFGAVPTDYDAELFALKHEVRQFFEQFYIPPIFWEHGVFRQTVFHAHLHCFPFGKIEDVLSETRHRLIISMQDDLRRWYTAHGHYFYLEDPLHALLFAPNMDDYTHIIQKVLHASVAARNMHAQWRTSQQRRIDGIPLIRSLIANWQTFQNLQKSMVSTF
jgi:diadenosine tetraphosphate (Ap4A) HIT family hydrolase